MNVYTRFVFCIASYVNWGIHPYINWGIVFCIPSFIHFSFRLKASKTIKCQSTTKLSIFTSYLNESESRKNWSRKKGDLLKARNSN